MYVLILLINPVNIFLLSSFFINFWSITIFVLLICINLYLSPVIIFVIIFIFIFIYLRAIYLPKSIGSKSIKYFVGCIFPGISLHTFFISIPIGVLINPSLYNQ